MPFALSRLSSEPQRSRSMGVGGGYESPDSDDSDDSCDTIRVSIHSGRAVSASSASRAGSPHYNGFCSDSMDDEPSSPLLGPASWWDSDSGRRRRRRNSGFGIVWRFKRRFARWSRHPLVPTQPVTILFSLVLFAIFAIVLTLFLIYQLNPDKEVLPWRTQCTMQPNFPPDNFYALSPVGVFLGIFSMDSSLERRMFVRTTFANHERSRVDNGTSRTVVRFILGKPRPEWERRIQLEAETYHDMIILPISENMNSGKTHAYFTWAASQAWVPLPVSPLSYSYANQTAKAPPLAPHDPKPVPGAPNHWVRPDFVLKADDDSFIMLAELEARLRVVEHEAQQRAEMGTEPYNGITRYKSKRPLPDPLVYWGYPVKESFMSGQLYGLSWSIVNWIAKSESTRALSKGAEDKLVAEWVRLFARDRNVYWAREECWMYDHPKAGTIYSHGYLFPSEVSRIKRARSDYQASLPPSGASAYTYSSVSKFGTRYTPPADFLSPMESVEALVEGSAMSKVASSHYFDDLLLAPSDALKRAVNRAWLGREGRRARYEGKKVGGTIVVHFLKKNEWWEEATLALLGGDEYVYSTIPHHGSHWIPGAPAQDTTTSVTSTTAITTDLVTTTTTAPTEEESSVVETETSDSGAETTDSGEPEVVETTTAEGS